jgi:cellulose synthase (UDP-forming)
MKNIGLVSGNVDSTPHGSEPAEGSPEDESFRDAIPRLPKAEEYFTRGFAVFVLFYSTYWLIWRWTSTINPDAVVFSVALAIADTMGVVSFFLLVFTCWKLTYHQPPPAPRGMNVDVFITTYDEPLEVLRRTAIGARAIRYPHRTYLLDDGERDEVRAMCQQLGVGYIRRTTHEHAKAGNLNHAMGLIGNDFILQLDADHVPLPNILDRMLGYFNDPKVGFVQSPQDYYNTDSFTHVVNDEAKRIWEENRIFYSLILAGKDNWNSAFFCGSCGIIRRKAFDEIGGFSTKSITEDMETSIVLQGRGWKAMYHGETLAYGLAPASATAYHVQRLRWGQGAMQILRNMNPLTYPGLTIAQRIQYFASATTYFDGYMKLILYTAPIIFFFTGWLPVSITNHELLIRLIPYIIFMVLAFEMLSRGTGWILISERYNMVRFWTYIRSTTAILRNKRLTFHVTPKGTGEVPFRVYLPQFLIFSLSGLSIIWATLASRYGWITYPSDGWNSIAFWLNGFWAAWNMYFAGYVVMLSRASRQQRFDHRFIDAFPIRVTVVPTDGAGSAPTLREVSALTHDLNPSGMAFRSSTPVPAGSKVTLPLALASGTVQVSGEVLRVSSQVIQKETVYLHGVRFDQLPFETRDAIELHCAHHSIPMVRMQYRQSTNLFTRAVEAFGNIRGERRYQVQLPAEISVDADGDDPAEAGLGLLEDISPRGARLLMETPVAPGRRISFEVPGTSFSGQGTVIFNRTLESPMRVRFVVGIIRDPKKSRLKTWTREWRALGQTPRVRVPRRRI